MNVCFKLNENPLFFPSYSLPIIHKYLDAHNALSFHLKTMILFYLKIQQTLSAM